LCGQKNQLNLSLFILRFFSSLQKTQSRVKYSFIYLCIRAMWFSLVFFPVCWWHVDVLLCCRVDSSERLLHQKKIGYASFIDSDYWFFSLCGVRLCIGTLGALMC